MLKTALLGGSLALAATQAFAVPVTLEPAEAVATNDAATEGVFPGTGFQYTAQPNGFELTSPSDIAFLRATVDPVGVFSLTVSREDGAAFDLLSIAVAGAFADAEAVLTGDDAETGEAVEQMVSFAYEGVLLTGVASGGGAVEDAFVPVANGTETFGSAFDDLASVTLEAVRPDEDSLCLPVVTDGIDARFLASGLCAEGPAPEDAPLQNVMVDLLFQDTAVAVELDAITVDTMAPIPVPASLPLLLVGLGALAIGAARRRAR